MATESSLIDGEYSSATVQLGSTRGIATRWPGMGPTRDTATVPVGPARGIATVPVGPTRDTATVPVGPNRGIVTVPVGPTRAAAALGAGTSGSARMKSPALWKRASGSFAIERITASTIGCGISRQ